MTTSINTVSEHHLNALIGKKLRLFRKSKNTTMQELSKYLGISHQQLQKYETGKNKLRLDYIIRIADFFDQPRMEFVSNILEEDFFSISQNKNFDYEAYELMQLFCQIKNKKIKKDLQNLVKIIVDRNQ